MTTTGTETKKLYIDGKWIDGVHFMPNINPANPSDVIGHYAKADKALVREAQNAARKAFPNWAAFLPGDRYAILMKIASTLSLRSEEFGTLLSREEGKLKREGIGEVIRAAQCFEYFAAEVFRGKGEFHQGLRSGFNVSVTREPVGVIGIITPWNFPIAIPAWKIAAALAYGNTIVFKPAELTPAMAWVIVEAAAEAGLPDGVLNLVNGIGREIGEELVDGTDAVTFTGSVPVGMKILSLTAGNMQKVQLELGGKSPMVIAADSDLELATNVALDGGYFQSGQRCTASSRLVVEKEIYNDFVDLLTKKVQALKVGDPFDDNSQIGPIASANQRNRIMEYVDIGKKEGAEIATGGKTIDLPSGGYFMEPTLFVDTDNKMRINQEEIFGPVTSVIKANDFDHAIEIANDTEYGLSSGICTKDLTKAERFRRASKAGMVMVNAPTAGVDFHVPFGGRDSSGFGGGEQGSASIDFFTERKTAYLNHGVF